MTGGKLTHGKNRAVPDENVTSWDRWQELIFDLMYQREVGIEDRASFRGHINYVQRGDLFIARGHSTAHSVWRSRQAIRRCPTNLVTLIVKHSGTAGLTLGDDQAVINPGDMLLLDMNRSIHSANLLDDFASWTSLHLDRTSLDDVLSRTNSVGDLVLRGDQPAAKVLKGFVEALYGNLSELEEIGANSFRNSAVELTRNALILGKQDTLGTQSRSLHRVQTELMARIREPSLRIQDVANELGIGTRKIHRLFQGAGTTPSKWIEERRLEMIANELRSQSNSGQLISQIALSFGYNDLSHFSRVFKRRYGVSPREYRQL